jgi:copper/silver efflux system protein
MHLRETFLLLKGSGFVANVERSVREKVTLPPGYRIQWSGEYEYLARARTAARLRVVVPARLLLILILL